MPVNRSSNVIEGHWRIVGWSTGVAVGLPQSIKKWFANKQTKKTSVLLYTRSNCHLCEDAKALLQTYECRYSLDIYEVDIDCDPHLRARYDACVPVVLIGQKERFRGRVNEVLLRRLLNVLAE